MSVTIQVSVQDLDEKPQVIAHVSVTNSSGCERGLPSERMFYLLERLPLTVQHMLELSYGSLILEFHLDGIPHWVQHWRVRRDTAFYGEPYNPVEANLEFSCTFEEPAPTTFVLGI